MERIKEISEVNLLKGNVLLKVHEKYTHVITPDTDAKRKDQPNVNYAEVVAVAEDVEDLEPGNIVLDFASTNGFKWRGDKYCIAIRMTILFSIKRDNFDFDYDEKQDKISNKIKA